MRLFFVLTLITLSLTGFAGLAEEAPPSGSLKQHMKEIGEIFKGIGADLKDSSQNAANADAATRISALFKRTQEQIPEHLENLPEPQRTESIQRYQEMIQQCLDLVDQLQHAFLNNDNALAQEIYRQMKDLKELGHEEFAP